MFLFNPKTYVLIGRSGTGKSYRAQFVAARYNIPLIIDDGLLIKGDQILAGISAKQAHSSLTAIKLALFHDDFYRNQVIEALKKTKYRKILVLGTSLKMVEKIVEILGLPPIHKVIRIEDIATQEEIETAMRVRYTEGQHVIPVNPIQITRTYPELAYDTVKVGLIKHFRFLPQAKKLQSQEKTVVKTEFTRTDQTSISPAALKQMVTHCMYEYESTIKVENVEYVLDNDGYNITVSLRTPVHLTVNQTKELEIYIRDSLEKYAGILVVKVNLEISEWASPDPVQR